MRTLRRLTGAAVLAATALGCDAETPAQDPEQVIIIPEADLGLVPDLGPDAEPNAEPDAEAPPPHLDAPKARLYPNDPITDDGELSEVTLHRTVPEDGRLTSEWVSVFNCLNEPGGLTGMPDFGGLNITVSLCHEVQTVRPDADGNYLSVAPPADDADPNDPFSELMMYHHVNRAHDYFKGTHDVVELDWPLPAIVNLQLKMDPPLPIPGFEAGPDGWMAFPNAAFFPEESWRQISEQFGLEGRDSDSIVFGQADNDFAYDGRVIYHEYTHAVIGTNRLQAPAVADRYGLDNSSFSMNEGLADYFSATIADDPVVGRYGIGAIDPSLVRDISVHRICPTDTLDEVHAHGKVVSSTLWVIREAVGAEIADQIAYGALAQFGVETTHQGAGALFLAEADRLGVADAVEPILAESGFLGCERAIPFEAEFADRSAPYHRVEGTNTANVFGFRQSGMPAYKQFYLDVPEGAVGARLIWTQAAGGGGFGGESPTALEVGLRAGAPVEVILSGSERYAYDQRFAPELSRTTQVLTLGEGCLTPGERVYLLWINPSSTATTVTSTQLEWLDSLDDVPDVETCGAEPQPDPEADAGVPEADAGLPEADAGLPEADAAVIEVDASPEP